MQAVVFHYNFSLHVCVLGHLFQFCGWTKILSLPHELEKAMTCPPFPGQSPAGMVPFCELVKSVPSGQIQTHSRSLESRGAWEGTGVQPASPRPPTPPPHPRSWHGGLDLSPVFPSQTPGVFANVNILNTLMDIIPLSLSTNSKT